MNILNVGYDSTNYYLIGNAATRLLIDIGWPGTWPKLLSVLKRKDAPLQAIKYLLITHYHPDHAGLAQELKRTGLQLIVIDIQLAAIPNLRRYMKPGQAYLDIDLRDNVNLTLAASRDFLRRIGFHGEIISTPGHSADSITLILDEGLAFTGDLPSPTSATEESRSEVELSWQRIRAPGVKTIYPGHGPIRPLA